MACILTSPGGRFSSSTCHSSYSAYWLAGLREDIFTACPGRIDKPRKTGYIDLRSMRTDDLIRNGITRQDQTCNTGISRHGYYFITSPYDKEDSSRSFHSFIPEQLQPGIALTSLN